MRHTHRILTRQQSAPTPSFPFSPRDIEILEQVFYDLEQLVQRVPEKATYITEILNEDMMTEGLERLRVRFGMCSQYDHTHYAPLDTDDALRLMQVFVLLAQDMRRVTDYTRQYSVNISGLSGDYEDLYLRLRHFTYGSSDCPASFATWFLSPLIAHAEKYAAYTDTVLTAHILRRAMHTNIGPLDRLFHEDMIRLAASAEADKHPSELLEHDLYASTTIGTPAKSHVRWAHSLLGAVSGDVIGAGEDAGIVESTLLKESDPDSRYRLTRFAVAKFDEDTTLPDIAKFHREQEYGPEETS